MRRQSSSPNRGFTLIELMVVVAIVGILASVAIPAFRLMDLRAKAAERGTIVRAMRASIIAVRVKDGTFGAGLVGPWQPALPLSSAKRPWNYASGDWNRLDMSIEGNSYYSYMFVAAENSPPTPPDFVIYVQGDIDGDGQVYTATYTHNWSSVNSTFLLDNASLPSAYNEFMVF